MEWRGANACLNAHIENLQEEEEKRDPRVFVCFVEREREREKVYDVIFSFFSSLCVCERAGRKRKNPA